MTSGTRKQESIKGKDKLAVAIDSEFDRFAFLLTKNPLFMWRGYRNRRAAGLPPTDIMLSYFDSVADALLDGNDPKVALRLAKPGGGAGPHALMKKFDEYYQTYMRYLDLVSGPETREGALSQIAAEKEVDQKTVRNHIEDFERIMKEINSSS